ncbi:hypothetical protein Hypma_015284 [Hypsizygus marmoreus]|uniref:Copper acquisition factor BIM1-like domain-containing protein n=1 Tax=Hypsizygus marmoreus TaxID=39966 RepID=A0A369K1M4_HYPMA|nr:hypothetical protein Hypma_015284 [Hypsizygus marmoreus]
MLFSLFAVLAFLSGLASAHFRLLYPEPRGLYVADEEPKFCGGYNNAVSNRTIFPLSGGFFTVNSGHGGWTAGVIISTVQNPTSFDNFSVSGQQQIVGPYAKEEAAGTFCIPLNISAAGIDGATDGANVTIQIVFAGGDGNLYQCADLTLSSELTAPPNATCHNETATDHHGSELSTSTAPSASQTAGSLGLSHAFAGYSAILLGLGGITLLLL